MKSLVKSWGVSLLLLVGGGAALHADPGVRFGPRIVAEGELVSKIDELKKQVEDDLRHVRRIQDLARRQNDIIKLTCVNDKYVALKGQANVFDEHRRAAEFSSDPEAVSALTADVAQAHRLRGEADACIGEPELAGESSNNFDHGLFPDDPTVNIFGTPIEPPVYASPFQ